MATQEDTVIVTLAEAIGEIADPALRVQQKLGDLLRARAGDVFIMVDELESPGGVGTSRREHLHVLIAVRTEIVAASETTSTFANVFAASKAIRDVLRNDERLRGGGSAGIEQIRRLRTQVWYDPSQDPGCPAGVLISCVADYLES